MPTDEEMREVALNQMERYVEQLGTKAEQHENQGRNEMAQMFKDASDEIRIIKQQYQ